MVYCILPFSKQPIKAKSNKQTRSTNISLLYFLVKKIVLVYSIGAIYFIINMTTTQLQSSIAIFVKVMGGDKIKNKIPSIVYTVFFGILIVLSSGTNAPIQNFNSQNATTHKSKKTGIKSIDIRDSIILPP